MKRSNGGNVAECLGFRSTELIGYLKTRGILASDFTRLRFVTHLDVDTAGIDRAIAAIAWFFAA